MDLLSFIGGVATTAAFWALKEILLPDFLDKRRQDRAARLQQDAEARQREREDEPIRQRIMAAFIDEIQAMRRVFIGGEFSLGGWQSLHDSTSREVVSDSGARALGASYQVFREALTYDQTSINIARRQMEAWEEPDASRPHLAAYKRQQHDARMRQNVATVVERFAPLVGLLGDPHQAQGLESLARQQIEVANQIMHAPPPMME